MYFVGISLLLIVGLCVAVEPPVQRVPSYHEILRDPSLWSRVMQLLYCSRNVSEQNTIIETLYSRNARFEDAIMIVTGESNLKVQFHSLVKFFSRVEMTIDSVEVNSESGPHVIIRNQQRYFYDKPDKAPIILNGTIRLYWGTGDRKIVYHSDFWDTLPKPLSYKWYQNKMKRSVGSVTSGIFKLLGWNKQ